ncbi:PAS domain-containing sensor histidine kinase [Labilibaculum sp. K2S]|uniref:PAS domain-containing protein n=1 Tax=Labilibaculum sp. K2S TaxID=3056386 RepID=UPI0025A373C3|nr:PAS domain-containing sensor histidine kinase [Labilibaculum sp. K2S]MDM8160384.1 PAS domain-containing sensor histidine kinase [Labilibaculum sp. K2S]
MYNESYDPLKIRVQELENEIERLRELIPQEYITEEYDHSKSLINGKDAVSVIDTNFTLIEVNEKLLKGTDLKRSELIGTKCYNIFYGLDKPCEECVVPQILESREPNSFLKSNLENNKIRFEEKYLSPILNKKRNVERIIIQSKDISSYYHLVDRIGQREEFYKNIFESAGDAFLVHDGKGNLIEFSSRLNDLLEYTEEELSQLNITNIDDASCSMDLDLRIKEMEASGFALFETCLISKSGKRIAVEVSANLIRFSNTNIYFVAIRNIEKRKIAENKLQESEERFRTLVENASDLIMRFDINHKHIFVNSASLQILKIKPEEFIGKTHQEIGFPKDKCEFWEREIDIAFKTKKQHCVDFSIVIEGKVLHFEWQLIPEFNRTGECKTLMAIARDITARKRGEEALNEAINAKDKFFSIIAHDLKNPFNALLPIAKNLHQNCREMSKDQIFEASSIIHSAANLEYNLLNNLLEWARSQMGKIKHAPKQIDLSKLIESNIQLHQTKADRKNIFVRVIKGEQTMAFADEYMLDTVIRNLYSNAIKFTRPGGNIQIRIAQNDSKSTISIEDDGLGISEENQKRLFRIDTNYTRVGTCEESGTGLGLILCHEFVTLNNGSISLESTPGKGSVFTVQLPINQQA